MTLSHYSFAAQAINTIRSHRFFFLCENEEIEREKNVVYEQTLSFACGAAIISNAYKTVKRGKKAKKQKYENNNTKWLLFKSPQQNVWLNFVNLCTICK